MTNTGFERILVYKLLHVFIVALSLSKCFTVVDCSVVLEPSPAIAAYGEAFTFTCTYNETMEVSGFAWQLNDNNIASILLPACKPFDNPGPPDALLYEYACPSVNQSTFTIKNISNRNAGDKWQCAVAIPGFSYSNDVTIDVRVAVTSVNLHSPTHLIKENVEATFTCETSFSRPAANITWYTESSIGERTEVTNNISHQSEVVDQLEKSSSTLLYIPYRTDNGSYISCNAINIPGRAQVKSKRFLLNVLYTPDGPPEIQGFSNGSTYTVIEHHQSSLSCLMKGGNPLATLTWDCISNGSSTITNETYVINTVTWNTTRDFDSTCTCQSSHPVDVSQTVYVNVQVLYPPNRPSFTINGSEMFGPMNFIEGTLQTLICESDGKPNPDSYRWTRDTDNLILSLKNRLTLSPVQKQDGGQYKCTANNTMVPSKGATQIGSSSSSVEIIVLFAPKIEEMNNQTIIEGFNFTFPCPVNRGHPSSTTLKWTRDGDNKTWGSQSLDLHNITRNDAMMYTCTVQNIMKPTGSQQTIGTDSGSFHLDVLYMATVRSFTIQGKHRLSNTVNESATVVFECSIDSNPASTIEILYNGNVLQREYNTKTILYTRRNVVCLDAGEYNCAARNTHNAGLDSRRTLWMKVRCSPRPVHQMKQTFSTVLYNKFILSLTVLAYPEPGANGFVWHKQNSFTWIPLLSNADLLISSYGLQTNLTINNVSISNYGHYRVTVTNEIGKYEQYMVLMETEHSKIKSNDGSSADENILVVQLSVGGLCAALLIYAISSTIYFKRKLQATQRKPNDKNNQRNDDTHEYTQSKDCVVNDDIEDSTQQYTDLTVFFDDQRTYEEIKKK